MFIQQQSAVTQNIIETVDILYIFQICIVFARIEQVCTQELGYSVESSVNTASLHEGRDQIIIILYIFF